MPSNFTSFLLEKSTKSLYWTALEKIIWNPTPKNINHFFKCFTAKIEDVYFENNTKEKLLGESNQILILIFFSESHVTSLCKKASQKLHALARVTYYMDFYKRMNLVKAFITSQFSYCQLIWMFDGRNLKTIRLTGLRRTSLD